MRAAVISLVVLSVATSAACRKLGGIDSKAAVQQAIEEHLKQQPNVFFQNMTIELGDVTFSGDTALAQVKFRSKQAPSMAVGIVYRLRKTGDRWRVESTATASTPGTTPHGGAAAPMPPPPTNPGVGPQPSH
jgi:ketosteroid isomerase-like protein